MGEKTPSPDGRKKTGSRVRETRKRRRVSLIGDGPTSAPVEPDGKKHGKTGKKAKGDAARESGPAEGSSGSVEAPAVGVAGGLVARSKGELARVYGCSETHIDRQIRNGAPVKADGGYDLLAWGQWWKQQGRFLHLGGQRTGGDGDGEDGENWIARKDRAQALLAEQKLADLVGMYCNREEVDRAAARDFTTLRLLLETVPDRCAMLVPADQRDAVLDAVYDTIRTTLDAMRAAMARWSGDDDANPVVDALEAVHSELDRLGFHVAKAVRGSRQKESVRAAVKLCVTLIRDRMAAAAEGEKAGT